MSKNQQEFIQHCGLGQEKLQKWLEDKRYEETINFSNGFIGVESDHRCNLGFLPLFRPQDGKKVDAMNEFLIIKEPRIVLLNHFNMNQKRQSGSWKQNDFKKY